MATVLVVIVPPFDEAMMNRYGALRMWGIFGKNKGTDETLNEQLHRNYNKFHLLINYLFNELLQSEHATQTNMSTFILRIFYFVASV